MMQNRPLVQWSFLQYKKNGKGSSIAPTACFMHSATQIGSKILIYGGCNYEGEALGQLFLYDTASFLWSSPNDSSDFQEDHPGARYGHTATLIEMHPPKLLVYGGIVGGGTYEFDAPDSLDTSMDNSGSNFLTWRKRKGKKTNNMVEELDENVYILTLNAERWTWGKPIIQSSTNSNPSTPTKSGSTNYTSILSKSQKPNSRCEHTAVKTGTNEITIFGGWNANPLNDLWTFNYMELEWKMVISSGIQPRPRYRHSCEFHANKLYILGGSDNKDDVAEDGRNLAFHVLSLDNMAWSHPVITGSNPFPRSGHSSALVGAKSIAIFGGRRKQSSVFNDLILIDLEHFTGVTINTVEAYLPTPVISSSLTTIGNKCFVFGGTDHKNACYSDLRTLDIGEYLSTDDITVNEGASSDYSFKVLIIGDSAVGKSSILTRFSENVFLSNYTSTIGIDFNSRMIRVDRAICKLEIWDTAGQERFSTMTANYYRGAQGALLVYDVTLRESFDHLISWYDRARQLGGESLEVILIGNKVDLPIHQRQVTVQEGEALSRELGGIPFVETSALNGSNVENAFVTMTRNIKKSVDRRGLTGVGKSKHLVAAGGVTLSTKEAPRSRGCGCS